jgi:hypothetical protein
LSPDFISRATSFILILSLGSVSFYFIGVFLRNSMEQSIPPEVNVDQLAK